MKLQQSACIELDLRNIHQSVASGSSSEIGLWLEVLRPKLTHFETNYSGDDYQPGLASLTGSRQVPHNLTGYWGAARDRIHASAYHDFADATVVPKPTYDTDTTRLHLRGSNKRTIAHIRSGQFWQNCRPDESAAYEQKLEKHLRRGLADIYARPDDLGDFGLRFVRNIPGTRDDDARNTFRKETCAAGFFRSLADLEAWARDCPSHHQIYGGAIHHKQRYGPDARMRTWHEVCVLEPGEARWEYVGCVPDTGTVSFQESEMVSELLYLVA